ncbi:uncharacterized protein [Aegilops tauschii subsp. strangulata]|uniref:uncharacterized protein n=1 Tax=Aegilops tauschii subsp. strangulata TaxID=200361 RepID=UPI00098B57A3|nr:uncharacterized protein LOC109732261 [Aegilops tauschii subsp. strangulata]
MMSSPKGDRLRYAQQIHFAASNNVAEYEALVHGLRLAKELGIWPILCYSDSDLVVQQCSGEWDARDSWQVTDSSFSSCPTSSMAASSSMSHAQKMRPLMRWPRLAHPSSPSRRASPTSTYTKPSVKPSPGSESIFIPDNPAAPLPGPGAAEPGLENVEPSPGSAEPDPVMAHPARGLQPSTRPPSSSTRPSSYPEPSMVAIFAVVMATSWALPISEFLENGVLPMDETEARQVQRWASAYNIINNELVKHNSTGVFRRCVEQDKGIEILLNIHHGECRHHAASRSLVAKAFRHGLYWPTALQDAGSLVLKCERCQRFSKHSHQPASTLRTIPITWPFAVWGLDMVGPFKTARGGMTHLLVAVDKVTKWIGARSIKKLDGPTVIRFI